MARDWGKIGWDKIDESNFGDVAWSKKFRHHEAASDQHGNLWGADSPLQKLGFLRLKSKHKDAEVGSKAYLDDENWTWDHDNNDISKRDMWGLFGQMTGKTNLATGEAASTMPLSQDTQQVLGVQKDIIESAGVTTTGESDEGYKGQTYAIGKVAPKTEDWDQHLKYPQNYKDDKWYKKFADAGFFIAENDRKELISSKDYFDMSDTEKKRTFKQLSDIHKGKYAPAYEDSYDNPANFNWMDVKRNENDKIDPRAVNWQAQYERAWDFGQSSGLDRNQAIAGASGGFIDKMVGGVKDSSKHTITQEEFDKLKEQGYSALTERFGELSGQTRFEDIDKHNFNRINWHQKFLDRITKDGKTLWEKEGFGGTEGFDRWSKLNAEDKWYLYQLEKGKISDDWDDVAGKDREDELKRIFRERRNKDRLYEEYDIESWEEQAADWQVQAYDEGYDAEGAAIPEIGNLSQILDDYKPTTLADASADLDPDLAASLPTGGTMPSAYDAYTIPSGIGDAFVGRNVNTGATSITGEAVDTTTQDTGTAISDEIATTTTNLTDGSAAQTAMGDYHTSDADWQQTLTDAGTGQASAPVTTDAPATTAIPTKAPVSAIKPYAGPIRNVRSLGQRERDFANIGTEIFKHRNDALTIK